MMIELIYLTTCNSQYFSGHHLPVLQVEVDKSTFYSHVKRELKEYYTRQHLDEDESIDYNELDFAIDRCFKGHDLRKSWDKSLDKRTDDGYDCYAFFAVKVIPRFSTAKEAEDILNASDKLVKISDYEWAYKDYEMNEDEVEPPRFIVTVDVDYFGKTYAVHKQYFFKKGWRDLSSGFLDDLDDEKRLLIEE